MDPNLLTHWQNISGFLGFYYIALALMNGIAAFVVWRRSHATVGPVLLLLLSLVYVGVLAPLAFSADATWMPRMPSWFTQLTNEILGGSWGAVIYTVGSIVLLGGLFVARKFFVRPDVAWILLNASLLALGLSFSDPNFYAIAAKPDNVPIVGLIFLLGFFTWLATSRAVENDARALEGRPPLEKENDEKILVWPDLVYTELICMILLTALLLFWAIGLDAPLEEPASSVKTPNPSKAPWYFLGLQEMLVYFDPWMAGVVLPSLIVVGLMAIPYLDFNPKGNGYYTIEDRKFSYLMYQFGFLVLWITLIVLGTFLRGPNWNIFAVYEYWDPHKVEALNNIDLSNMFWEQLMGVSLPKAPNEAGFFTQLGFILYREWLGIAVTLLYFIMLPPLMAATVFRGFFVKMGFMRFMVMSNLILFMALLPIKMVLRWTVNLKYIIAIPEYFLNL
ncbi:MAG: hypothetical protein DWQ42_00740 [Planctomycetota bacterium]|nr:MAG: hypothetical protein DWQ42_00740 [Planctomycetota bacterium]REK40715.1 MAG: hypothetical protein DWQ46_15880 [Planctomycetota bacterium]